MLKIKLQEQVFTAGIRELEICTSLKLTKDVIAGWFEHFKYFSDDTYRKAIFEIIDTDLRPTFNNIKKTLWRYNNLEKYSPISTSFEMFGGGQAGHTPELRALTGKYMGLLAKFMATTKGKAKELKKQELINNWLEEYKKLPFYFSEQDINKMIKDKDFDSLENLGLLKSDFDKGRANKPKRYFVNESNQTKNTVMADYVAW